MNNSQLIWLARRVPKRQNKWYAALEQSGLSASNFMYSLIIIKLAGIADLGTYSYWFVVCQFMAMLTVGLATRQMVLQFSSESLKKQYEGLSQTCIIVILLQLSQSVLMAVLILTHPPETGVIWLWIALVLYSAGLNFSELFRQFYYMRSHQRQSLWFSGISTATGTLGFLLFAFSGASDTPGLAAFWFLAFSNALFVTMSYRRLKMHRGLLSIKVESIKELCRSFWLPGLPATGGMLVTWAQNQSVTPLLMFMFGPLWVGYYSVARMIVTPVSMVTSGLSKSALPQIRRAYGSGDHQALDAEVQLHCRTTMRLVIGYMIFVGIVWAVGRSMGFFQSGDSLLPLFATTVIIMILSSYRFWISQKFVVRMQFSLLLRMGIAASSITVSMMLISGLVFESPVFVALAPAVGELFLLYLLQQRLREMAQPKPVT